MAKKINAELILELQDAHVSRNGIASTRRTSRHSVSDAFHITDEKGVAYRDVRFLDEDKVYRMFYPDKHTVDDLCKNPDYEYTHQELRKTGATLKLLQQEYKGKHLEDDSTPMGYTEFCKGYGNHAIVNKLTNHLENKPGVKIEADWSGPATSYVDTSIGEVVMVYLLPPYPTASILTSDLLAT